MLRNDIVIRQEQRKDYKDIKYNSKAHLMGRADT